jgi:hypothetical protein
MARVCHGLKKNLDPYQLNLIGGKKPDNKNRLTRFPVTDAESGTVGLYCKHLNWLVIDQPLPGLPIRFDLTRIRITGSRYGSRCKYKQTVRSPLRGGVSKSRVPSDPSSSVRPPEPLSEEGDLLGSLALFLPALVLVGGGSEKKPKIIIALAEYELLGMVRHVRK